MDPLKKESKIGGRSALCPILFDCILLSVDGRLLS